MGAPEPQAPGTRRPQGDSRGLLGPGTLHCLWRPGPMAAGRPDCHTRGCLPRRLRGVGTGALGPSTPPEGVTRLLTPPTFSCPPCAWQLGAGSGPQSGAGSQLVSPEAPRMPGAGCLPRTVTRTACPAPAPALGTLAPRVRGQARWGRRPGLLVSRGCLASSRAPRQPEESHICCGRGRKCLRGDGAWPQTRVHAVSPGAGRRACSPWPACQAARELALV